MCNNKKHKGTENIAHPNQSIIPTWILILGLIILFLACIAVIYLIIHRVGVSSLDLEIAVENWFSYLVTLIGACATIMVGFQVYNAVESRKLVNEMDGFKKEIRLELKNKDDTLKNYMIETNSKLVSLEELKELKPIIAQHSCALSNTNHSYAVQQENEGKYFESIVYYIISILYLPYNSDFNVLEDRVNCLCDSIINFNRKPRVLLEYEKKSIIKLKDDFDAKVTIFCQKIEAKNNNNNILDEKKSTLINLKSQCILDLQKIANPK